MGYTAEEFINLTRNSIMDEKQAQHTLLLFVDLIKCKYVPENYETNEIHKNGHTVCCETTIKLILDDNHKPKQILGVTKSIENRKQLLSSFT